MVEFLLSEDEKKEIEPIFTEKYQKHFVYNMGTSGHFCTRRLNIAQKS